MKKSIFLFFFVLLTGTVFSQVFVDGVNINTSNTEFCFLKNSISGYYIDYGQEKVKTKIEISDKDGNSIKRNKIIPVLNFMDKNGWELISFSKDNASDSFLHEVYIFKKN